MKTMIPRHRVRLAGLILLLGLLAVGGRLVWLQVVSAEELLARGFVDQKTLSLLEKLRTDGVLSAQEDGRVVVDEMRLDKVVPDAYMADRVRRIAAKARIHPGQDGFDFRLVKVSAPNRLLHRQVVLRGGIYDRQGLPLATSKLNQRDGSQSREYPLGAAAQPVLGFFNPVYGCLGLESYMEPILLSPDPVNPVRYLLKGRRGVRTGNKVFLTLDSELQKKVYDLFDKRTGAAVVIDVKTGGIRAAVSAPAFDPSSADSKAWLAARNQERGKQLKSRAWDLLYAPGSTFKLAIAATWLESQKGPITHTPALYVGKKDLLLNISEITAHGKTDLFRALVRSSNIYFARLGVDLGVKSQKMVQRMGFNKPVDLIPQAPELKYPVEPSLAFAHYEYKTDDQGKVSRKLKPFTTWRRDRKIAAQCAIGQNQVRVTPLQMASVAQAIANGGLMREPYLVMGLGNPLNQDYFRHLRPPQPRRVMKPQTAEYLKRAMAEVMISGTGRSAPRLLIKGVPVPIAGKTGTAETGDKDSSTHAWFVGFAPADEPRYAVAVMLEKGGRGGKVAAPFAVKVLEAALTPEIEIPHHLTADLKGNKS